MAYLRQPSGSALTKSVVLMHVDRGARWIEGKSTASDLRPTIRNVSLFPDGREIDRDREEDAFGDGDDRADTVEIGDASRGPVWYERANGFLKRPEDLLGSLALGMALDPFHYDLARGLLLILR
jgi:hypothetical protein